MFGASKLKDSSMNLPKPALSPLSATMRLLPTTTMSMVRTDLTFLSFKASTESKKISLMFNSDHQFLSLSYFFWAFRTACGVHVQTDRKSTRLNSSHANISYAVFCLKKKKYNTSRTEEAKVIFRYLFHTYTGIYSFISKHTKHTTDHTTRLSLVSRSLIENKIAISFT